MAEFNEVNANEAQKEVSVFRSEDGENGNEETVVKIKLLEEPVSLQVPVEERSVVDNVTEQVEADTEENEEAEKQAKEAARKEKRRQRREKRRGRKSSKGSTSDENDLKQDDSSQEKKAKIETEEEEHLAPKNSEKGGEPMEVQGETRLTVNLAGSSDGTEEAEVYMVQSERIESAARDLRALLEASMDGEACDEPSEEDPEAEQRAKEDRARRAEEVLAAMDFENKQQVEPDLQVDDPKEDKSSEPRTPADEAAFTADCQAKVEAGVDLSVLDANESAEPTQDAPNEDTLEGTEESSPDGANEEGTGTSLTVNLAGSSDGTEEAEIYVVQSERKESAARDVRALLEANMDGESCEPSEEDPEAEQRAKEDRERRAEEVLAAMDFENKQVKPDLEADDAPTGEIVEEFFVAQEAKKDDIHLQLVLSSDGLEKTHHEEETTVPKVNEENKERVALSEEEKEAKLNELFQEEVPKGNDPKEDESPEPRTLADEAEFTADCQVKVEAGVDLSVLDTNKSTQDGPDEDSLEGKEESSPDGANEEETEETGPSSEVQESVEEYVSVPDRKIDLCLEALSSGDELPNNESLTEEAQRSTEKEPPKDLDSLFSFHPELQAKKEDEGEREQQAEAVGEEIKEEEVREERKAADVERALDMSFLDEPEENEKPGADEAGAEISETLEAETKTKETISSETHLEKFTESKTTYTTSILIKPVSPTPKKAPAFETADISQTAPGEALTHSTVTTTLETIMVTKAPDSQQVVHRRNLKKEIEDAFEPLPDKESEGTAPLAQVEGTGSEDDLLESAEGAVKSGNEKEPLIEKARKEEEPGDEHKKAQGEEPEVATKKPEARDEEQLIPEEKKKKGKAKAKCCVLQ